MVKNIKESDFYREKICSNNLSNSILYFNPNLSQIISKNKQV